MEVSEGAQSRQQATKVLHSLFPDLEMNHISILGEGWDSAAYLVDDNIVVRVPKRPAVGRQMAREVQILEAIRPYVCLGTPLIEWVGKAQGDSSVSAIGYRNLPGTPLSAIAPGPKRDGVIRQVAQFLRDLHAIPTNVLKDADVPWFRWTGDSSSDGPDGWKRGLQAFTDRIMEDVVPLLNASTGESVRQEITAFLGENQHFDFHPVLIHGDLSPEHIFVDTENGEIGVIDFGDSGIGDPAYDVMDEFLPWYGDQIDGSFQARQRFYRRLAPFHSVLYGMATGDEALIVNGLREVGADFLGDSCGLFVAGVCEVEGKL